jgi:hypothetical protein
MIALPADQVTIASPVEPATIPSQVDQEMIALPADQVTIASPVEPATIPSQVD